MKNNNGNDFQSLYKKTKNELLMLSEITNAMMQSLKLDHLLYTILTALTSHEGLGFNRAMFFLVNEEENALEGKMAIGAHSAEEADKIWQYLDTQQLSLQDLIDSFDKFDKDPESRLNGIVKNITVPLLEDKGILALTILEGMPFEINTEKAKSLTNDKIKKILNLNFFVTMPLKTRDHTVGLILVDNIFSKDPISKDDVRILSMFAAHAGLAIENSRLYEKTVHLSRTDWLTGLWNARYFNDSLAEMIGDTIDTKASICLLMIDIDNFKRYNDVLGHQEGNQAIKRVADVLKKFSRKNEFVCRYGGEEFSIVMANTEKNEARIIAQRLRFEVEKSFENDSRIPEELKLTISLGLSSFPNDSRKKNDLIKKADLALYHSKKIGKNKVSIYSPELAS